MCSDDADLKPQEEEEERKDDSLRQNRMQCDEGHIDVHSQPRARPTPASFIFTVSHVDMWLNRELHWNIEWGGGYHESREAGRKATWVLLNLVLEFAFIIKSVVFGFRVGLFLTATHLPQKMFLLVRRSAADVQLAVRCSDTLDSISGLSALRLCKVSI